MPGELAAVVVSDGAARRCRQPAQFFGDDIGGDLGIFAEKTPGQGQPGCPFLQRQENVALAAEVHQIAFPVSELAAQMGFGWPLMDRRAVRDRRLAPTVAPSPAALRLALREEPRQARAPTARAVDVALEGLHADRML